MTKIYRFITIALSLFCFTSIQASTLDFADYKAHSITFNTPSIRWEESLPLGNGRFGMMPYGGIEEDIMYKRFTPKKSTTGGTYGSYQCLGELFINQRYNTTNPEAQNYIRSLDLTTATATTSYSINGIYYSRNYYVDRNLDLIIVHISTDTPGEINFSTGIHRGKWTVPELILDKEVIELSGVLNSGLNDNPATEVDESKGMKYAAYSKVFAYGKQANVSLNEERTEIDVENADEAWIVVSASTTYFEGKDYKNGKAVNICMGPTMDNQLVRELFTNTLIVTFPIYMDFIQAKPKLFTGNIN